MDNVTVVPGPPGTGKTRRCLDVIERELRAGSHPSRIAYVSFTRAAVNEGRNRAMDETGATVDELPYFRTLHSLALFLLGGSPEELLSRSQLEELGSMLGESITGFDALDSDGEPRFRRPAATALFIDQLARSRVTSIDRVYGELPASDRPPWPLVKRAAEAYRLFRHDVGALDFTDLLERATENAYAPNLDLAVVDEAQDLTPLQWRFVRSVFANAKSVLVCGDDDQAIFRWAGADPSEFVDLNGYVDPLSQSYRLPKRVHDVATRISRSITYRREKAFSPTDDEGEIVYHRDVGSVPVADATDRLILARHGKDVNAVAKDLRHRGIPYRTKHGASVDEPTRRAIHALRHWSNGDVAPVDDAKQAIAMLYGKAAVPVELPEMVDSWIDASNFDAVDVAADFYENGAYLRALSVNGYDPVDPWPAIRLSTIHGAKGAEADEVAVLSKLNKRTGGAWRGSPDDERRVLYVALTRARKRLDLVQEGYRYEYPFTAFDPRAKGA